MSIVTVNSVAGLSAALKVAHGGDTIELAPGSYSGVQILGANFTQDVTITSASAASKAVLVGLAVGNSSGLNITNVSLSTVGVADPYYAFRISNASNVTFSNLNVFGNSAKAPGSQTSGFLIEHSSGISISNSQFNYLNNGIAAENDSNLSFSGNYFSSMSKGGIQAGQVDGLIVSNNYFTNFNTSPGTHADAIQLFTAGTTAASQNITIENNTYFRGSGTPAQGIFLSDEVGNLAYENVTISGNQIMGGDWNSIYLSHAVGSVNVSSNYVDSWTGYDVVSNTVVQNMLGRIVLGDLSGANLTEVNNTAQAYFINGQAVSNPAANTLLGITSAVTTLDPTPAKIVVPATDVALLEHATITGNALAGVSGSDLALTAVGIGSNAQKAVGAQGTSYLGAFGTLTVHSDGTYSYVETKDGLIAGQTYKDNFTTTVSDGSGHAVSSSVDVVVTGTSQGNGASNNITAGAGIETISGFGPSSVLTGGSGQTTFSYSSVAQSTPATQTRIQNFVAGDIIDLSQVDPKFHIVKSFDGHPDELVITHLGTGGAWGIYGDITGSGHADFQIYIMSGTNSVTAANFHL